MAKRTQDTNTTEADAARNLSRRERQIMDVLYAGGELTAAEVLAAMPEPPSYSTVRALLRKLLDKNQVLFREDGPRYVYRPVVAKADAQIGAVQRLVNTFFGGSATAAVAGLLGSGQVDAKELDALETLLAERRRQQAGDPDRGGDAK